MGGEDDVPSMGSTADFDRNVALVQARIDAAAVRVDRDPAEVRLLPVSKTVPEARLQVAVDAGCTTFGENKVQEAYRKWQHFGVDAGLRWSIIGHLQTNKARHLAEFAHEFQALDSPKVAEALDRRLQAAGRSLDVMVQVNTSGEASKFGLEPADVAGFVRALPSYSSLRVRGLMTIAALTDDAAITRACFVRLRTLRDQLRDLAVEGVSMDELSMGMSGDLEIAVEEGSTTVRVGQAIFGRRPLPDSHYWPSDAPVHGG